MKKHFLRMVVFAMALLVVPSTIAQGSGEKVLVNVPFAFIAESHQLPAGRYTVTRAADGLIFHRYGDSYFLAQVWSMGWGRELPKSKAEKEFALSQSRSGTGQGAEVAVVRAAH
jgi:hypothetical protein